MNVASALIKGRSASADLAREAVERALAKAGGEIASSVLLFLTPEYARDPHPALLAASRAASCTCIFGCTAPGVFTEDDWVLDGPAAAAMVLAGGPRLSPIHEPTDEAVLSLAAPFAMTPAWLASQTRRFGAMAGDATGQGEHRVWCSGKVAPGGHCEAMMEGARCAVAVSQGILALGTPLEITDAHGYDLRALAGQPALHVLARNLPPEVREMARLPLHLLMVGVTQGDPRHAIPEGRFRLTPVINASLEDGSATLAIRPGIGEHMFWALRQPFAAERDMAAAVDRLAREGERQPDFGLLFSCIGRGPYFYGGVDRDLELVKDRFPGVPLIGCYGNGEIAPLNGASELLQYSAVLAMFYENV